MDRSSLIPATTRISMTRVGRALCGATAGLLILAGSQSVQAKGACNTHEEMMRDLDQNFSEVPVALGLIDDGRLIEIFVSPHGKTWTAVITGADGMSCPFAVGGDWQPFIPEPIGSDS